MKRALFFCLFIIFALLVVGDAAAEKAFAVSDGKDMILNIVREVLGIIVDFIGDILDEFVRAIKEIMNSGDKS